MKVGFLLIVLAHTDIAQRVTAAMESIIGKKKDESIQSGLYSTANYLCTNYMKKGSTLIRLKNG